MIPMFTLWERVKRIFGKDILEVVKVLRDEFDTMIPMFTFWERVEGILGKDILKVVKVLRDKLRNCFRNIILPVPSFS